MAQCNFSIPFQGSAADLVAKAQAAIIGAGGTFSGNTTTGNFTVPTPLGEIVGNYTMNNASPINIVITKKPFLVSCATIQSKLQSWIGSDEFATTKDHLM